MIRAKTSDPLPAGYVTTMVTGRVGQSCAAAVVLAAASAADGRKHPDAQHRRPLMQRAGVRTAGLRWRQQDRYQFCFQSSRLPTASDKKFKRHHGAPDSQCAIKTGKDALAKMCRVAPPKIICRNRLWV